MDKIYIFIKICSIVIIRKYIVVFLMKISQNNQCGKLIHNTISSFFEGKFVICSEGK